MPKQKTPTFYLLPEPSFLEGMARTLDLGNTLQIYNYSDIEARADYNAILSDWLAVGQDIKASINTYEAEQQSSAN